MYVNCYNFPKKKLCSKDWPQWGGLRHYSARGHITIVIYRHRFEKQYIIHPITLLCIRSNVAIRIDLTSGADIPRTPTESPSSGIPWVHMVGAHSWAVGDDTVVSLAVRRWNSKKKNRDKTNYPWTLRNVGYPELNTDCSGILVLSYCCDHHHTIRETYACKRWGSISAKPCAASGAHSLILFPRDPLECQCCRLIVGSWFLLNIEGGFSWIVTGI